MKQESTSERVEKLVRMTTEPVEKLVCKLALPTIISMLVSTFYNMADTYFVGKIGYMSGSVAEQAAVQTRATAAVGVVFSLMAVMQAFGFFFGHGSGNFISRSLGSGNEKPAEKMAATGFFMSFIFGIIILVFGQIFAFPWARLLGASEDFLNYTVDYMRIILAGAPIFMSSLVLNNQLRFQGNAFYAMVGISSGAVINLVLDPVFIFIFDMEVMGAALATILSQIISAVLVMGSLMRTRDIYRLHLRKISIDWIMLKRIIRIGFPAGVQSILYSVSNVIIQSAVNSLGTNNVAAWAAYGKVDGLFWMMINALGIAATTFVGQNYGAKKMDRVHRGVRTSMIMAFLMTGLMVVFMWFIGDTLISLFTTDTAVREICHGLIHFLVPTFFTYISIEILSGALRGVGDAWIPMFITGIGICGVRIVWMTAVLPHFHSLKGAAFCYPLSWVITTIAYFIYYLFFSQLSKRKELRSI